MDIETYDNLRGGNVAYKALAHPIAAESLARIAATLKETGKVAVYDPHGIARTLLAMLPTIEVEGIYVHDSLSVDSTYGGLRARALTDLADSPANAVLIAAFEAPRLAGRVKTLVPGVPVVTLDAAMLPQSLQTNPARYLDPVNFATNFAFFRDDDRFATRLTTVNYWRGYGAEAVSVFLRLYNASGAAIAEWREELAGGPAGLVLDSGEIRRRFGLPAFAGQLFMHVVGAAGHDIVKYTLDVLATGSGLSLSATHDANAWPADRYAGLPSPRADERVILWVQNSHGVAIPAGAMSIDCMGMESPAAIDIEVPPFGSLQIDVGGLLPDAVWPSQVEFRSGKHVVRPRYEVERKGRRRIAHLNVERNDLRTDPGIRALPAAFGRGFLLPFPILPRARFRTLVLPTPMSLSSQPTPLRVDVFSDAGEKKAEHFLGILPRNHRCALDFDDLLEPGALAAGGHAELTYDFREGGEADGWLHALFRFEDRDSGHVAESSFGAHIFNTLMTYKNEPQSYGGAPPGLSTKLFLKLGASGFESFAVLIYPASARWHDRSSTKIELHRNTGEVMTSKGIVVRCGGSTLIHPHLVFGADALRQAGRGGYLLVKDDTCRLFGFHGLDDGAGRFSFDHMFGF